MSRNDSRHGSEEFDDIADDVAGASNNASGQSVHTPPEGPVFNAADQGDSDMDRENDIKLLTEHLSRLQEQGSLQTSSVRPVDDDDDDEDGDASSTRFSAGFSDRGHTPAQAPSGAKHFILSALKNLSRTNSFSNTASSGGRTTRRARISGKTLRDLMGFTRRNSQIQVFPIGNTRIMAPLPPVDKLLLIPPGPNNAQFRHIDARLPLLLKSTDHNAGMDENGMIAPSDPRIVHWMMLQSLLLLYTICSVPLNFIFGDPWTIFVVIDVTRDILVLFDVIVHLHTGYISRGQLVMSKRRARHRYATSFLVFDLLASLVSVVEFFPESEVIIWLRLLRLFRLLRFLATDDNEQSVRFIGKLFFYFFLLSHMLSCIAFKIVTDNEYIIRDPNATRLHKYLSAMFWTLGTFSGLYEPQPQDDAKTSLFIIVIGVLGVFIFGILLTNIHEAEQRRQRSLAVAQTGLQSMLTFTKLHNLPKDITEDIVKMLNYRWACNGHSRDELLKEVAHNTPIHKEVSLHLAREQIQNLPFLNNCPEVIQAEIAVRIQPPSVYCAGQYICKEGDLCDGISFISVGLVRVTVVNANTNVEQTVNILKRGQVFNERALFVDEGTVRAVSVIASEFTEVQFLSRADFLDVMRAYPDEYAQMRRDFFKGTALEQKKWTKALVYGAMGIDLGEAASRVAVPLHQRVFLPTDLLPTLIAKGVKLGFMFICFAIPIQIAFAVPGVERFGHRAAHLIILDLVTYIALLASFLLNFNLAFVRDGNNITDLASIRARYRERGALLIARDIVIIIPFDLINYRNPYWKLPRLAGMLTWAMMKAHSSLTAVSTYIKLIHVLLNFGLYVHLFACAYWMLPQITGHFGSTEVEFSPTFARTMDSVGVQYIYAVMMSLKLLTGRGRPLHPHSVSELFFAIIAILTGQLVVALLISTTASFVVDFNPILRQQRDRQEVITEFLDQKEVAPALRSRVYSMMINKWDVSQGTELDQALQGLPEAMRIRIRRHMMLNSIKIIDVFSVLNETQRQKLLLHVRMLVLPPFEYVYCHGQLGTDIFIVERGSVSMRGVEDGDEVIIGPGNAFGEEPILERTGSRVTTVTTVTPCSLFVIGVQDLTDICGDTTEMGRVRIAPVTPSIEIERQQVAKSIVQCMINKGNASRLSDKAAHESTYVGVVLYWFRSNTFVSANVIMGDNITKWIQTEMILTRGSAYDLLLDIHSCGYLIIHAPAPGALKSFQDDQFYQMVVMEAYDEQINVAGETPGPLLARNSLLQSRRTESSELTSYHIK